MLELRDKWVWDFWFCQDGETKHIFYLQAPKALGDERLRHFNATIGHACSPDWIHWEVLPDALGPGKTGEWDDLATWTGSTITKGDSWYLFYTGVNEAEKGLVQRIGVAVSLDLLHWEKYSGNPIIEADPLWYELLDLAAWHDLAWRDPWVFEHQGKYYAYITARAKLGDPSARGVIALAESADLLNWKVLAPVTQPGQFGQLEVPQLVQGEKKVHLVFSTDRFSHAADLLRRTAAPAVTGTASFSADSPLGPFRQEDRPWLFADGIGSRYSGKFIHRTSAEWTMMAFENYDREGRFVGRILDPFRVPAP